MKSRWLSTFLVLTLAVLGLTANVAYSQTTGEIEGTLTDTNGGPLPGAAVEIKSASLQGTRTAVTDAAGRFRFPALAPGNYTVTAALSGFGKVERTNVRVGLGATATVLVTMTVSVKEEIVVTGEAPAVDVASTTTGTTYTARVISQLPVGRNYADIVRSQPGVQTDTGETQGRSLALSIYGSTSAENLYLIDGVNTTNVIKGFQGKSINNEFVEEVEVKTGGYQAEFGRNTGGVINVITKSGGNEFHGDAFGYYDNTNMKAQPRVDASPAYSQDGDQQGQPYFSKNNRTEFGIGLGGFFVKDRLWFYGAYDRVDQKLEAFQTAGIRNGEAFPRDQKSDLYSGKLTVRITDSTTLIGTVFADPQTNEGLAAGGDVVGSTNSNTFNGTRELGGTDYAAKVSQLFGTFGLATVQYARHKEAYLFTPAGATAAQVTDNTPTLEGRPAVIQGGWGQVFGPTINNESTRDAFGGAMSLFLGSHEIKFGGDYQKDVTSGATYNTGDQRLTVRPCTQSGTSVCDLSLAPVVPITGGAGTTPVFYQHRYFTATGGSTTPYVSPFDVPSKFFSFFLQDTFKVLPNLTVNAGIRYDDQKVFKGNGDVAFHLDGQWAPRVGFAWDPTKDGSTKVYGSYGKFYWPTPTDLNVRVFTANNTQFTYNYSPTALAQGSGPICTATVTTNCTPRASLFQGSSFAGEPVEEGLKGSYQNEFTFGVEKALNPTFSLGVKFTYRKLGEGVIEDRCDLDPDFNSDGSTCAITNAGGSGFFANGQSPTCNASSNPTDPDSGACGLAGVPMEGAKRNYWGIELVAKKRVTNSLFLQASYIYSQLRGNYSGAIRVASGQTDPGINADYDYWQFTQNADGILELDRPHQFRVDAVYNAPFGLNVGLNAYVRSGQTTNKLGYYNSFYPDLLYLQNRGSGERLPVDYEANLSLGYELKVGPVTITPQLYIFNLLNRQTVTHVDEGFNPNGYFVTNHASPFYGQAGVEPGTAGPDGTVCAASVPCSDNIDYRKADVRGAGRSIRVAVKATF
ncbi:MAG: TonB-dependent receptor [Thermoanaerobaculia bacterium]|nr:TonB-dependent receptor [Thermoanaerobaculia bacterium]